MKRYFSSIRARLGLVLIAGVVPAVLLVSLTAAWRETGRRIGDTETEFNAIAEALAVTIATPLAQGQDVEVVRALRAVGRMPAIRYARVVGTHGEVVAQFGVGVVLTANGAVPRQLSGIGIPAALRLKNYSFSTPVVSGGVGVGRLDLVADVSGLGAAFRWAAQYAILMALVAAGLGLLIAMPMIAVITRPIRSLTGEMRRIQTTADFSPVDPPRASDETAVLVGAFNDMLSKIRDRDDQLARHRSDLERAVVERTAELQVAKLAAESANAAKSDFLAAMSHEIRTPMHGMLVTTELLQTTPLDDRQKRYAEMITKSGRSLLAIVNDILDLSKIEAGRMELEKIPLEPAAIASDVVALFADRAAAKGLRLETHCAPDVPQWIVGDPVRLNQILANLVGNAIKFTARGRVDISLVLAPSSQTDGTMLRIAVTDTGIGIPHDSLGQIFDAFVQADQTTSRQFGGTGIGLAICRKLAAAMGGTLSVESRQNEGSTFTCTLPVTIAEPPAALQIPAAAPTGRDLAGVRVLAADDNAVNRAVLAAMLGERGAELVCVEDGEAAVAAFKSARFDIVYMDCSMPVLDGYGATRLIRAWERETNQAATPVVALTAQVIGSKASQWRDAGMDDCLTKPFTLSALLHNIERWTMPAVSQAAALPVTLASATATPPEPEADPLDREVIGQILAVDRNGEFIGRLVRLYRSQGREVLDRLAEAVEAGDIAATGQHAHAFKSISLSIGARPAADLAGEIERSAANGELRDLSASLHPLTRAFEAALVALDEVATTARTQPQRQAHSA